MAVHIFDVDGMEARELSAQEWADFQAWRGQKAEQDAAAGPYNLKERKAAREAQGLGGSVRVKPWTRAGKVKAAAGLPWLDVDVEADAREHGCSIEDLPDGKAYQAHKLREALRRKGPDAPTHYRPVQ